MLESFEKQELTSSKLPDVGKNSFTDVQKKFSVTTKKFSLQD
jgi:hypothetical protein